MKLLTVLALGTLLATPLHAQDDMPEYDQAIHQQREDNDYGLPFNEQNDLPPIHEDDDVEYDEAPAVPQQRQPDEDDTPTLNHQDESQTKDDYPDTGAQDEAQTKDDYPDTGAQDEAQTKDDYPDTGAQEEAQTKDDYPDTGAQDEAQTKDDYPDTGPQDDPQTKDQYDYDPLLGPEFWEIDGPAVMGQGPPQGIPGEGDLPGPPGGVQP